jgi:hypothetical protein
MFYLCHLYIKPCLNSNGIRCFLHKDITIQCIEDVLALNNFKFGDFVDRINQIEVEMKDSVAAKHASFL